MSNFKVKKQVPEDSNIKHIGNAAYRIGGLFSKSILYRPNKYQINLQSEDAYTLTIDDNEKLLIFDNVNPINVTVPNNSSTSFEIGTRVDVIQEGEGTVTFVEDSDVTINSKEGNKSIGDRYVAVSLIKVDEDTWYLIGDLIS
jgi:predicted oxidoreductase (fatty acid repression mutant protein)